MRLLRFDDEVHITDIWPSVVKIQHWGDPNRPSTNGPVHTADITDTKGCGLAIAYTDDIETLKPTDFTVFSVNHTCVWYRETYFDIPENMPPCPNGKKCICSWNWLHGNRRDQGYGNELYSECFKHE